MRKYHLLCITFHQRHWIFNLPYDTWQEKPTSLKNWNSLKLFFTKEAANIKHHTTGSVRINYEDANTILQLSNAITAQHQEIANIRDVQEKTGEQQLIIQEPQIQSIQTDGKNQQHKSSASGR